MAIWNNTSILSNESDSQDDVILNPSSAAILALISLPGVIANSLAVAVTLKILKVQPVPPNYYLCCLGVVDLLGLCSCVPPTLLTYATGAWQGGLVMCTFQGIMSLFTVISSGTLAVLMSIDRFLAIKKPFFYRQHKKPREAVLLVSVAIASAVLFSICPLLGFGAIARYPPGTYCTVNKHWKTGTERGFSIMYSAYALTMGLTVIFCNVKITADLWRNRFVRTHQSDSTVSKSFRSRKTLEIQFTKVMGMISIVFLCCWIPFMAVLLGNVSGVWMSDSADIMITRLLVLKFSLDPLVYVLTGRQYRRTLVKLICKRCIKPTLKGPDDEDTVVNMRHISVAVRTEGSFVQARDMARPDGLSTIKELTSVE